MEKRVIKIMRPHRIIYFLVLTSCAIFLGCEEHEIQNYQANQARRNISVGDSGAVSEFSYNPARSGAPKSDARQRFSDYFEAQPSKEIIDNFVEYETQGLPPSKTEAAQESLKKGDFQGYIEAYVNPVSSGCSPLESSELGDEFLPFRELTDIPIAGCGYKIRGFTKSDVKALCEGIAAACEADKPTCHVSNCTTASYLGIIEQMRTRSDWEEKKSEFTCRPPQGFGKAYRTYTEADGLRKLFNRHDLGNTKRISPSRLPEMKEKGWPSKGDALLLQRKSGSGHAVIFDKYEYDKSGKIKEVCYWSSNSRTKGAGKQCERISKMQFIDVGKVDNAQEVKSES